jgi:serine protease
MRPIPHTHALRAFSSGPDTFAPCFAARTSNLRYHHGSVQTSPAIYLVFWGFQTYGDPSGEANRLTAFMNALGASAWLNTVTQYYQTGPQYVTNPSGQLAGTWYDDADPVPAHPRDADIRLEAIRLAQHFAVTSPQAAYVVATPSRHNIKGFPRNYCAYHGDAAGGRIPYTNLPYMSDGGQSCGAGSVNSGSAGLLDGVTIVGGHELAETQTDPNGGGWFDAAGNEIGDKCAWRHLQNTSFGSLGTFPTQPLWSNAANGCIQ